MAISNRIATAVALLCTGWSLTYVAYGASPQGHDWYSTLAKRWFDDYKGGVPIINLALPLLIMSSASAILVVGRPPTTVGGRPTWTASATGTVSYQCHSTQYVYASRCWPLAIPYMVYNRIKRKLSRASFDMISFIFILIPCLVYFASDVVRHLYGHDLAREKQIMEVSNAGGQMAMVALSFFLVPVARHSVLLDLMGWSQEKALRMHIWSGRICVMGALFHGSGHMLRWFVIHEKVIYMLLPETGCWRYHNEDYRTTKCSNCYCYDLFRNFTGLIALVFLLVIGFSSLCWIRRARYKIFYTLHLIAGPTSLLFSILHWNRMVLYICPSILYYVASTVPVLIRLLYSYVNANGVKIISATDLSCPSATGLCMKSCICLVFEVDDETARQFRPGMYLKLSVPSISTISHPFTVNRVLGTQGRDQMEIIFRVTGSFTHALANKLLTPRLINTSTENNTTITPLVLMDGFYGQKNMTEKLYSHDVAVIVAGGVGITPYLSLLSELCSAIQRAMVMESLGDTQRGQEIHLHWICRDQALINYVKREYISPFLGTGTRGSAEVSAVRIVIHNTGRQAVNGAAVMRCSNAENHDDEFDLAEPETVSLGSGGLPLSPSRFTAASTTMIHGNLPIFLTFSSIVWVGLVVIWFLYNRYASKSEVLSRTYGVLALIGISLIFGVVANIVLDKVDADNSLLSWNFARKHTYTGLGGKNKGGSSDNRDENEMLPHTKSDAGLSLPDLSNGQTSMSFDDDTDLGPEVPGNSEIERSSDLASVTVEYSSGRPSLVTILSCLDAAHNPGVFVCGPSALVKDVKAAAR